jgi:hypothetical protein
MKAQLERYLAVLFEVDHSPDSGVEPELPDCTTQSDGPMYRTTFGVEHHSRPSQIMSLREQYKLARRFISNDAGCNNKQTAFRTAVSAVAS